MLKKKTINKKRKKPETQAVKEWLKVCAAIKRRTSSNGRRRAV
jgi:hypothetical protein